jgi:hypothetical protein
MRRASEGEEQATPGIPARFAICALILAFLVPPQSEMEKAFLQ